MNPKTKTTGPVKPVFQGGQILLRSGLGKRSFDFTIALAGLILAMPILLLVALGIKLTSRGPVFYAASRRGLGGREFRCFKFRSMYLYADIQQGLLEPLNQADGPLFKMQHDPRVTGFGYWIRRYSLDELPQLWNVLKGEMSLVGPRPLPERDHALLQEEDYDRYQVLPGLTGLWQVSGRSQLGFEEMMFLDRSYIQNHSLRNDLLILLKTVPAVLTARGAV